MKKIEDLLKGVLRNISLKKYNTFQIGGKAKYFYIAKNNKNLISAILAAQKTGLPFFILGKGSNLLISDDSFEGLVIRMLNIKYKIKNTEIFAAAGITVGELLNILMKNDLTGLEWAIGIPGTLGGAVYGNAGAFGQSIEDIVEEIEIFNIKTKKIEILKNRNCRFGYRQSIFKKNKDLIILSAKIQLKRDDKKNIKNRMQKFLDHRKMSQPLDFPSAGSIFKNPKGFFAAKLIEDCDLKGKRIGGAEISKKHANFVINLGRAKAKDVIRLIDLAKKSVKNKFGINLEEEIEFLSYTHLTNFPEMKK